MRGGAKPGIAGAGADILGGGGAEPSLCGCFRAFNAFARVCVAARGAFRVVVVRTSVPPAASFRRDCRHRPYAIGVCGVLAVFPGPRPDGKTRRQG